MAEMLISKTSKRAHQIASEEHDRALLSLRNAERSFQNAESELSDAVHVHARALRIYVAHSKCLAAQEATAKAEQAAQRAAAREAAKKGQK